MATVVTADKMNLDGVGHVDGGKYVPTNEEILHHKQVVFISYGYLR